MKKLHLNVPGKLSGHALIETPDAWAPKQPVSRNRAPVQIAGCFPQAERFV